MTVRVHRSRAAVIAALFLAVACAPAAPPASVAPDNRGGDPRFDWFEYAGNDSV